VLPIVDSSANQTKKVSVEDLFTNPNVTGTLTADGLTVDGGATFNQGSGDSINIFRSTDYATLKIGANATDHFYLQEFGSNDLYLARVNSSVGTYSAKFASNGDISFYNTAGTSQSLFWDASAESLGIGTTAPNTALHVKNLSGNNGIRIETAATDNGFLHFADPDDDNIGRVVYSHSDNSMQFVTNDTERMRIDSSGNLLVGTTSQASTEKVSVRAGSGESPLHLTSSVATGDLRLNLGTGTAIIEVDPANAIASSALVVKVDNSERMRLDSSGNLLVGKTTANTFNSTAGFEVQPNGLLANTRDGGIVQIMNRLTSDGDIAVFRKDGTTVGSIGASSGDLVIGTGVAGVRFNDSGPSVEPRAANGNGNDGGIDLGLSGSRFRNLYLSGGVYLGGTGAANQLDDYEEGTFTPVLSTDNSDMVVSSYSAQQGYYTKVGNLVTVVLRISCSLTSVGTGDLKITGIPFNISNDGTILMYAGIAEGVSGFSVDPSYIAGFGLTTTQFRIRDASGNNIEGTDLSGTEVWLRGGFTYRT
jgi:hypothetical protein